MYITLINIKHTSRFRKDKQSALTFANNIFPFLSKKERLKFSKWSFREHAVKVQRLHRRRSRGVVLYDFNSSIDSRYLPVILLSFSFIAQTDSDEEREIS